MTNVLFRMVDAPTTVKTYLAVTSAFAQMQSSHWLRTTILVKVTQDIVVTVWTMSNVNS